MPTLAQVANIHRRWSSTNSTAPEEVKHTSQESFILLCLTCEKYSERKAKDIYKNPERCGVCAGKIIIAGYNDALTHHPFLAALWGKSNTAGPETYSRTSGRKVWIVCNTCGEENLRQLSNTISNPEGCVVCSGKKVIPGINDLASNYPNLALEWSPRNKLRPHETIAGGRGKFLWLCQICNEEWEAYTGWRIKGTGCPYCSGQKPHVGVTDVASSLLFSEWHHNKNTLKPNELTLGSNTKVWWLCGKGHESFLSPNQRWDSKNKRIRLCKQCLRGVASYGEEELLTFLRNQNYEVISSARSILSKGEIDCYIPALSLGFEFNGNYWHSDAVVEKKYGIKAEVYHQRKLDDASAKGIRLFFIWADDWYGKKEELQQTVLAAIARPDDIHPSLTILSKG